MLRLSLLSGLVLALLGSCQSPEPAAPLATNYRTHIPDPKKLGETYVSDPDTLLAAATVASLNARLDSLDRSGRAHIDVALTRSIGEAVPKTAAHELFNQWKIGDAAQDNGLLLLLVADQRRLEFETGYGLEGDLPDAICYRIQQRYMVPALRAGHYDQAVQQGVAALIRQVGGPAGAAATDSLTIEQRIDTLLHGRAAQQLENFGQPSIISETPPSPDATEPEEADGLSDLAATWLVAGLALVLYLPLAGLTSRGRPGRGWWLLGATGLVAGLLLLALNGVLGTVGNFLGLCYLLPLLYMHGYFLYLYQRTRTPAWQALSRHEQYQQLTQLHHHLGFTAFLFPVALVGYWVWHQRRMQRLRDAPYPCPRCGQLMRKLQGPEEKEYLAPGQQAEEAIESIDYDLWQCPACAEYLQLVYPNLHSSAQRCPACHYKTLLFKEEKQVKAATTAAAGWGWRIYRCRACQHERQTKYTIPRLENSSSSSGSSFSSSSSSGGSSSSSTSSGGSSGGGGAGSSW